MPELMQDVYTEAHPEVKDVNYTPVFYKADKDSLLDSGYFLYDGLNDANSKSVTWAVLEEKATGKQVVVASTHLWWMFDSEKDNQQRLQNVAQLKAFCDKMVAEETTDMPTCVDDYPVELPDKTAAIRRMPEFAIDYIFTYNIENLKAKKFDVLTHEDARRSSDHSPVLGILEF